MNSCFKVIFNQSLGAWVAVSELAKGHIKSVSTSKLLGVALLSLSVNQVVTAQQTTQDFTHIYYNPSVQTNETKGTITYWGDASGDGAVVANAGQNIKVTGTLKSINNNRQADGGGSKPSLQPRYISHKNELESLLVSDETKLAEARAKYPSRNIISGKEYLDNYAAVGSDGAYPANTKSGTILYDFKTNVTGLDPITNLNTSYSVYDNDKFVSDHNKDTPRDSHAIRTLKGGVIDYYTETRLVTAKEGGEVEVTLSGGNATVSNNHYLDMYIKRSHLFAADGKDSRLSFAFDDGKGNANSNTLYFRPGDTYYNSIDVQDPQATALEVADSGLTREDRTFSFNKLKGTFTPSYGDLKFEERSVSTLAELKSYNEFLIGKIQDGTIKNQGAYDNLFKQAIEREEITVILDQGKITPSHEFMTPMGSRSYFHASNGGIVEVKEGTTIVSRELNVARQAKLADPTENNFVAAFSAQGEGSQAINRGNLYFQRGTIHVGQGMVSKDGGTVVNAGTIYGGMLPDTDTTKLPNYQENGHLMRALDGGTIKNTGTLNVVTQGQVGMAADAGGNAVNEGHIHVGYFDLKSPPDRSATFTLVGMSLDGSGTHSNTGSIHLGNNNKGDASANIDPMLRLTGVKIQGDGSNHSGSSTYGFTNDGKIKIYDKVTGATAISIEGNNNRVLNKQAIEILGSAEQGKTGDRNIGINFVSGASNYAENQGNIFVKGSNNIGVRSLAAENNDSSATLVNTSSSTIEVHAAQVRDSSGKWIDGGLPNYGVWAEGGTIQVDGKVQLKGSNTIAIHARNQGQVALGSDSSVETDANASNQTSYFIHGSKASITNNSSSDLVAAGKDSTVFRIDGGATYDGTIGSNTAQIVAQGANSTALLITGAGSTVKTGNATITASGDNSVALKVAGGASGELNKETTLNLTGQRARAAVVDGELITIEATSSGIKQGTELTSLANITSDKSATDSRAYEVTNEGKLIHEGSVNLGGSDEIAVLLTKGGHFVNTKGDIVVAGTISDTAKTRAAVDVSGQSTNGKLSVFEHQNGNIQLTDGQYGDAAIRISGGASLDMSGKDVSPNATIKAGGDASVILVDKNAAGLKLGANTLSLLPGGTGAIVENKAEIKGIAFDRTVFEVTDGIAIRSGNALADKSSGTINISGNGTGIVFANRDTTNNTKFVSTTNDLHVGGLTIDIQNTAQDGATGLYIDTTGNFSSDANINLKSTNKVSAWNIKNAGPHIRSGGTLKSVSTEPIIDLSGWITNAANAGKDNTFTNEGTITSPGGTAINYGSALGKTINFFNQKGQTQGDGIIDGSIEFGKAQVNLTNANGGEIKTEIKTDAKDDTVTVTGTGSDISGGMNLGAGANTITVSAGATQTGAITTGDGADKLLVTGEGTTLSGKVNLGDGANEITVSDKAVLSGNLATTDGADKLSITGEGTTLSGNVNLGDGANEITVSDKAVLSGRLTTGDDDDTFTLAGNASATKAVNLGGGANTITVSDGAVLSGNLTTGDGKDKLSITGEDTTLSGNVNLGDGANEITVSDKAVLSGRLTTGADADSLTLTGASKVTGDVDLGAGQNTIKVSGTSNLSGSLTTGAGVDTLTITDDATVSGDVYLGRGNDIVNIENYTGTNAPFTSLDGEAGKDSLNLTNSTVDLKVANARVSNFEDIKLKDKSTLVFNQAAIVNTNASDVTFDIDAASLLELNDTTADLEFAHQLKSADGGVFKVTGNGNKFSFAQSNDYSEHKGTTDLNNVKSTLDETFANAVKAGTLQLSADSEATVGAATKREIGHLTMNGGTLVLEKPIIPAHPDHSTALVVNNLNITDNKGTVKLGKSTEFLNDFDSNGALADITKLGLLAQDDGVVVANLVKATGTVTGADKGLALELDGQDINTGIQQSLAIKQDNDEVATATYGFKGAVSDSVPNKGINAEYGLAQLSIHDGKQLELRPAGSGNSSTLQAKLTGKGGITVNTADQLTTVSINNYNNDFTGETRVAGGTLELLSSNALGSKDSHTQKVTLAQGTGLQLTEDSSGQTITAYAGALDAQAASTKVTLQENTHLVLNHRDKDASNSVISHADTLIGDANSTLTLRTTPDHASSLTINGAQSDFKGKAVAQANTTFHLNNVAGLGTAQIHIHENAQVVFDNAKGEVQNTLHNKGTLVADNQSDISLTADNSDFNGVIDIRDESKVLVEALNSLGGSTIETNKAGTLSLSKMQGVSLGNEIKGSGTVALVDDAQVTLTNANNDFAGTWDITDNALLKASNFAQLGQDAATIDTNASGTLELTSKDINGTFNHQVAGTGTIALRDTASITLAGGSSADKFAGVFDIADDTTLTADRSAATSTTDLAHNIKGNGTYAVNANGQDINFVANNYSAFKGDLSLTNAVLTLTDHNLKATHNETTLVLNDGAQVKGAKLDEQKEIGSLHFSGGTLAIENSLIGRKSPNEAALLVQDLKVNSASEVSVLTDDFKNDLPLPDQMISLLRQDDEPGKAIHLIKAEGSVTGAETDLTVNFVDSTGNTVASPAQVAINQNNEKVADANYALDSKLVDTPDATYNAKGLYAQYLLQSLNLAKDKQLQLIADDGFKAGDAATLSAQLTGEGGISVGTLGSTDVITLSNENNTFTGQTTVEGGTLNLASSNALGSEDSHTQKVTLAQGTGLQLTKDSSGKAITAYAGALDAQDSTKVTLQDNHLVLSHRDSAAGNSVISSANTLSGDANSTLTLRETAHESSLTIHGAQANFAGKAEAQANTSFILRDNEALGTASIHLADKSNATFEGVNGHVANTFHGEGSLIAAQQSQFELTADNSSFKGPIDIQDGSQILVKATNNLGNASSINTNDQGRLHLSTMQDASLGNEIKGSGTVALVDDAQVALSRDNDSFAGTWDITDNAQLKATDLAQLGNEQSARVNTNDKGTLTLSTIDATFNHQVAGTGTIALRDTASITLAGGSSADKFAGVFDIADDTTLTADRSAATAPTTLAHNIKGNGTYAVNANGQDINFVANDYSAFKGDLSLTNAVLTLTDDNLKATHKETTLVLNNGAQVKGAELDNTKTIGSLHFNEGQLAIENSIIGRKSPNGAALQVSDLAVNAASGVSVLADKFSNDSPLASTMTSLLSQDDGQLIHLIKATGDVTGDEADLDVSFVDANGAPIGSNTIDIIQGGDKVADASYALSSKLVDEPNTTYADKGLYAHYQLTQLDLVEGKQLQLIPDAGGDTTLSAQLTGKGGISVGTPGSNDDITIANENNAFSGQTTVEGGKLIAGSKNALGDENTHSSLLDLKDGASFELAPHLGANDSVHVGCVSVKSNSGGINLNDGHLAIHGCSEGDGVSTIDAGKIQGSQDAVLELSTPAAGKQNKVVSTGPQDGLNAQINIKDDAILQIDDPKGAGNGGVDIADKGQLIINTDGDIKNNLSGDGDINVSDNKAIELTGNNTGLSDKAKINLADNASLTANDPDQQLGQATVDTQQSGTLNLANVNGTINAKVAGDGNLAVKGDTLDLQPDTLSNFTGNLNTKGLDTLIAGKPGQPVHLNLKSPLVIEENSKFAGVGSIAGDIVNKGDFIVGDVQKGVNQGPGSKSEYRVGGDFTNKSTGTIILGSPSDLDQNIGSVLTVGGNYHGEDGSKLQVNTIWNNPNYSETDRLVVEGTATGRTQVVVGDGVIRGDVTPYELDKFTVPVVEVHQPHADNVFWGSAETEGAEQVQLVKVGNDYRWKLPGTFSQSVPGYAQAPVVNMNLGFSTVGSLHERLGAKSQYTKDGVRIWGQVKLGELDLTGSRQLSTETEYSSWILGADIATQVNPETKSHNVTGVMFSYTDSETDAFDDKRMIDGILTSDKRTGGVDSSRYGVGVYHTRYHQSGAYLDLVAEVAKLKNKYSANNGIRAKQDGWSAIVSAEAGHHIPLANNFFVEPQVQLMYQHINLDSFRDKARKVDPDSINAVRGRIGVRAGKNFPQSTSVHTNSLYGLANLVRDFSSSPGVHVGKDKVTEKFNRTFVEFGIGGEAAIGKSFSLYADGRLERNLGSDDRKGFRAKVGVKYSW